MGIRVRVGVRVRMGVRVRVGIRVRVDARARIAAVPAAGIAARLGCRHQAAMRLVRSSHQRSLRTRGLTTPYSRSTARLTPMNTSAATRMPACTTG